MIYNVKKILIPGMILGLLAASVTPVLPAYSVYAAVVPVSITGTSTYVAGTSVRITGSSPAGKDITFKMLDSSSSLIHVDAILGKDNPGQFQFDFTLPSNRTGAMTIIAGYGGGSGEFTLLNVTVSAPSNTPGGSGIGGGGGGIAPPVKPDSVKPSNSVSLLSAAKESSSNGVVTVTLDAKLVSGILASEATPTTNVFSLEVKGTGNSVQTEITAEVLKLLTSKNADTVLQVQTNTGTYNLPLGTAVARQLGGLASDEKIVITIKRVEGTQNDEIKAAASGLNAQVLGIPVEFTVSVVASNGSTKLIESFTNYVSRTIAMPSTVNPNSSAGVMYDPDKGTFSPVPTLFNGTTATLFRKGNSVYTILDNPKTFADISGHWAQRDIELLASKLIVNGVAANQFAPDHSITRAEFAALLGRSLAVSEAKATGFTDVAATDWFSGAVGAAQAAQLIGGYEDGTFRPNAKITREQMVTMIIRAFQYAGTKAESDSAVLNKFTDSGAISEWSKVAVAQSIKAGIIQGMTDTTFAPQDNATRAQATLMLERMLHYLQFLNK